MTNLFRNKSNSERKASLQTALIVIIMTAVAVAYILFEANQS
ncbi:MAG: hypothetical protein JWP88_1363 [Flaviaesturariibacter sp.]|nr:hypothetical protein [Flaviaesturariibacter sp.]